MGVTKEKEEDGGKKPAFTDDQKEELSQMVGGAVASFMKRGSFKEMIGGVVTEAIGAAMPEVVKALKPAAEDKADKAKTDKAGGDGKTLEMPAEWKAQFEAMSLENKKLAAEVKANNETNARRTTAERVSKERGALEKALGSAGVPAIQAKAAAIMLHEEWTEKKRIKSAEDGTVTILTKGQYGDEDVAVEKSIGDYMKTEDGKALLPAQPGGSGGSRGNAGGIIQPKPGQQLGKSEKLKNLAQSLLDGAQ